MRSRIAGCRPGTDLGPALAPWLDGRPRGDEAAGRDVLMLFHAGDGPMTFWLPRPELTASWSVEIHTGRPTETTAFDAMAEIVVDGPALVVLLEAVVVRTATT